MEIRGLGIRKRRIGGGLIYLVGVDGEGLPHDDFADVGGDEEGNAAAEAVLFLKKLIETEDEDSGEDELEDDEEGVERADVNDVAVHAGQDISNRLNNADDKTEELFSALVQFFFFLGGRVDVDDLGAEEELHDQARGDDGGDAELHEGAAVGGEEHAHFVEGIAIFAVLVSGRQAVHWNLQGRRGGGGGGGG
jgi:hypothetical protein